MYLHQQIFYVALYLSYILYIFAYFRIGIYDPKYLGMLDTYMKTYIALFLLIRFNPFVKPQFTEFDRTVVFSSAIFLLTTTVFAQLSDKLDFLELVKIFRIVR
jgi:hypothetical protein